MAKNKKRSTDEREKDATQKNQDMQNKQGPSELKKRINECI